MIQESIEREIEQFGGVEVLCGVNLRESYTRIATAARQERDGEVNSLMGLLKIAVCPDTSCDNNETGIDQHGDPYQCQWCYERRIALTPPNRDGA